MSKYCYSYEHSIKKENVQYFLDKTNEYPKISDLIIDYLNSYILGLDFADCQRGVERLISIFKAIAGTNHEMS